VPERDHEHEDDDTELDEELDEVEPTEADLEDAATPADPPEGDVESIQEVLEKQEARDDEDEAEEDEPIVSVTTARDERLEPLDARVIPMQSTEFVCKNCYLVKHRSQLADKRRMLCRDCA
jgi:cell division septation protein DedD